MPNRTTIKLESPVDEPIEDLEAYIDAQYHKNSMPNSNPDTRSSTWADLRSSGVEDTPPCEICESITSIKRQLQKLDSLEQLTNDKELKASVEFNNSLIEVLKTDNASLRTEVNSLKRLTAELQKDKVSMSKSILDLQCRSMRDNITFHGVPEAKNETQHKSEELVKAFLVDDLKIKSEEAEAIHFSRVHCIGKAKSDQQRPRPIVAKVTDSKMRSAIMFKDRELRGSNYSICDQFPPEIMNRRRLLYPILAEARKSQKNTH